MYVYVITYLGTDIKYTRSSQGWVFYISSAAKRYPDQLYESTVFRTKCKKDDQNISSFEHKGCEGVAGTSDLYSDCMVKKKSY
jgi:hypothetical protein